MRLVDATTATTMSGVTRRITVAASELDGWCRRHLGARVDRTLFTEGHLSWVAGVELVSGRRAVVKVRPPAPQLLASTLMHRRIHEAGFPCPAPLVDLEPLADMVASAEALVEGGALFPASGRDPASFAHALAWLVDTAAGTVEVSSLDPPPPWTAPDHTSSRLWPPPDDSDGDLNRIAGPDWVDEAGEVARAQLAISRSPRFVGHGDWYTSNLRWAGNQLHTVWDWDSAVALPEPVIAGLAAAVYPTTKVGTEATVDETARFLDAYQHATGRPFDDERSRHAWAAGLWNRAFDAKKAHALGRTDLPLDHHEAEERQRRALGM